MTTMTNIHFESLSLDQLCDIVGGNVAYDIGYGVGQISYIALEVFKLRRGR